MPANLHTALCQGYCNLRITQTWECSILFLLDLIPQVEVELAINTNSSNYYIPRGEQIAHDVDGSSRLPGSEEKFFARYSTCTLCHVHIIFIDCVKMCATTFCNWTPTAM